MVTRPTWQLFGEWQAARRAGRLYELQSIGAIIAASYVAGRAGDHASVARLQERAKAIVEREVEGAVLSGFLAGRMEEGEA